MPIVKVHCLPDGLSEGGLRGLYEKLVLSVLSVKELGLTERHQMTVLFPPDRMLFGLGEEIIVEIVGLYAKPERTKQVQDKLARAVGDVIKTGFPKANVEVFVHLFDPSACGFWKSG